MKVCAVGKTHDSNYIEAWKVCFKNVLEGYQSVEKLSDLEIKSLYIIMCSIEMLFVAYFYRVGDKKNAKISEDVLRWLWTNRNELT